VCHILFVILAATGIALFLANLRRRPPWLVVGVTAFSGVGIMLADAIAHGSLQLYKYRPHLPVPEQADGPLGLLMAEFIFVPGLASCLAVVRPRIRPWLVVPFTAVVSLIEIAFVAVGHLEYDQWRTGFTAAGFPVYFAVVAWWTGHLERNGYENVLRAIVKVTTAIHLSGIWAMVSSAPLGRWRISPHILGAFIPDRFLGLYLFFLAPVTVVLAVPLWFRWDRSPWTYPACWAVLVAWFYFLAGTGKMILASRWLPGEEAAVLVALLWAVGRLDRWMGGQVTPSPL
jgi:putative effector of murein hydrolase